MKVLKFAWCHSVLDVEEHDDLDDALASAYYAAENGSEALDRIEVFEDGQPPRVLTRDEVSELNRPRSDAQMAEWRDAPTSTAMIEIANSDGRWARYSAYVDTAEAITKANELRRVIGQDRVRVMPLKNGLIQFGNVEPIG